MIRKYFTMERLPGNKRPEITAYFFKKYLCKLVLKYVFKCIVTYIVLHTFKNFQFNYNTQS